MMKYFRFLGLIALTAILTACAAGSERAPAEEQAYDWRSDWALEEGFSISVDSEGYYLPTALAFVPDPGRGPKDPLYFVTELRGAVKVVTNDRTVHTFAEDFFELTPRGELPSGEGQAGLAGICLEPRRGYVFVTFAYQDSNGVLRNNIVRFDTQPETFALQPTAQTDFRELFLTSESGLAHQIGPCQIKDDLLYVSVGEAWRPTEAQKIDVMTGKIIRMTLDGKPVPDNPFYQDSDVSKPRNYVWAAGLRNPFGLKIVAGRVFVADNGNNIDRFLEIKEGENYFWNGNDWSIATNAAFVFVPGLAPVQLDFYQKERGYFPEQYDQTFFVALSGGPDASKVPGIATLQYGLEEGKLLSVPKYFLKYRGEPDTQIVSGLAFGPDGLYVVPILPNKAGRTAVLKIVPDPQNGHPFSLEEMQDGFALMKEKGCLGCHQLNKRAGYGGTAGPPLDTRGRMAARIRARLDTEAYVQLVREVDRLEGEPYVSYKHAREEVLAAEGTERVRLWMKYHIMEPKFDNPYSQMPNLGLSETQALLISDYLLGNSEDDGAGAGILAKGEAALERLLPRRAGRKLLLAFFLGGFVLGGLSFGSIWLALRGLQEDHSESRNQRIDCRPKENQTGGVR